MSDRRAALAALCVFALLPGAALGQSAPLAATILDLPFAVTAMRGPGSEVAIAAATSGLLPGARPKAASANPLAARPDDESAPIAVVWGERGGAVLNLAEGQVRTTPLDVEAIERFAAAETPRGAMPGSRRALMGPLSAHLSGPTRAPGGGAGAAGLTVRERQPVAMSGDPKPVPVATDTVPAGSDAVFAPRRPRIATIDGRPVLLAVTRQGATDSALALIGKGPASGDWGVLARTPPQAGTEPLAPAAVGDVFGNGRLQVAAVRASDEGGVLQLWTYADGALALAHEAPGYAAGPGEADLAATIETGRDGVSDLALPVADRSALAVLSLKDGIRERVRVALPAPAATGLVALGRGAQARLLVGLADGRLAVVYPGPHP